MRIFLALLGALAGLGLALFLVPRIIGTPEGPVIEVLELRPEDENATRWREHMEELHPPTALAPFADSTLERASLPLEILQKIYPPLRTPEQVWDAHLGFRRPSDLRRKVPWDGHPKGGWLLETNGSGMRMDFEPTLAPGALVVGIAGDSHIDGVCDNRDAMAGLLQASLEQADLGAPVEVVNTANGGHSFYQYLGAMELLIGAELGSTFDPQAAPSSPSRLDAMIVNVYGGNDFNEVLKLAHYFGRTERPQGWGIDNERLVPWRKTHMPALAQAVDGLVYFRNNASEAKLAMARSLEITDELLRHAQRREIPLLFVYLPSALEAEPALHGQMHTELLDSLAVTPAQRTQFFGLGDTYIEGLRQRGASVIDFRELMSREPAQAGQGYFWTKDLHLNPKGHQLLAEDVRTWLEGVLP